MNVDQRMCGHNNIFSVAQLSIAVEGYYMRVSFFFITNDSLFKNTFVSVLKNGSVHNG